MLLLLLLLLLLILLVLSRRMVAHASLFGHGATHDDTARFQIGVGSIAAPRIWGIYTDRELDLRGLRSKDRPIDRMNLMRLLLRLMIRLLLLLMRLRLL